MLEDYPVLYVLARSDLDSLNPGKLAAQVAHSATQLSEYMYRETDEDSLLRITYKKWTDQAFRFGTVITLAATKEQLLDFSEIELDEFLPIVKDDTIDPTYPFFVNKEYLDILRECDKIVSFNKIEENRYIATRREHTCSWIFGMKSDVSKYVDKLNLYKQIDFFEIGDKSGKCKKLCSNLGIR